MNQNLGDMSFWEGVLVGTTLPLIAVLILFLWAIHEAPDPDD